MAKVRVAAEISKRIRCGVGYKACSCPCKLEVPWLNLFRAGILACEEHASCQAMLVGDRCYSGPFGCRLRTLTQKG